MAGSSGSRGGYGWPFAENKGDGRLGWIGRDPEENKVAAARGKGGRDKLEIGFRIIYITRGLG